MFKIKCHWVIDFFKSKMPFYAVRTGRNPGIYNDWDSCKTQVDKFPKARYKKFATQQEAEDFVNGGDSNFSYQANSYSTTSNSEPSNSRNSYNTPVQSSYNGSSYSGQSRFSISPTQRLLKEQVNQLTSMAHQLSKQIETYEKSKRSYATSSCRSYSNESSNEPGPSKKRRQENNNYGSDEPVTVYTDGACFGNGRNGATAGIGVYWGQDHPDNVSERLPGRQTNNRAEIHAAVRAINQAKSKGVKNLVIKTDSQFMINGITKWIHGWKRNGWKLSTGQPVVNKADFEDLDSTMKGINVQWEHVRGHRGITGNEAADKLANEGAVKPKVR